ncbi:TonB-dependent receptor [Sphingosinicella ginsenosidimutans]|uniref:TonB-dependent receptor n=1 Tax=Allosphingosinicella ginsenosidimutans TaxID=1176539 RepID=A0A5C6TTV8_9SPHN|nr:TonB-dependent receptor [Sphingosinicella ginsenosidimutans]TXC63315.1 TonB-dependent receptor [Sphingosinicella ginsenosidimutans]
MKSFWLLSAGIVALASPAHAQDQGSDQAQSRTNAEAAQASENDGQTIIVTAQGRRQILQDVPIAVSAVGAEQLQNSGANDIRQLNQLAPSLLVSSTGSEANGSARIRGIGTVGDNPGLESSVAVFIDGVYRSRSGIGLNELGEIDHVEVLRGPQGTLFGRNASAGLINIITRRPDFDFGGSAELTYGNYNYVRAAAGVTGPISEALAFRLDGVYVRRDGFYDVVNAAGGTEGDVNDRNRFFTRGQLLYQPDDRLSIRLIGDYTRRNESCCGAVVIEAREAFDPTPGVPGDAQYAASNRIVDLLQRFGGIFPSLGDPYNRDIAVTPGTTYRNVTTDWGVSAQIDYDFGNANLTSITAYRGYKSGGAGDVDYTNVDLLRRDDDGNSYRRFRTFTQEVRLQGRAGFLDWLVGGYFARESLEVSDNLKFGAQYGEFAACRAIQGSGLAPTPAALLDPTAPGCMTPTLRAVLGGQFGAAAPLLLASLDRLSTVNNVGDVSSLYDQRSTNWALFTHDIFHITDTVSLTVGLRYTHERKSFVGDFNNNNTICPAQQAAIGPLLANPALAATVAGILTLSCVGNSSALLNGLDLRDSFSEGEWTGTGVLSWQLDPRSLIYASYSRGYKAGGYNLDRSDLGPAYLPRSNADAANLRFAPEIVNAFEVGLKLSRRNLTFNLALFRENFRDFQLNTFNGTVFIVQNIQSCSTDLGGADQDLSAATGGCAPGDTRAGVTSTGIEMEASFRPAPDLNITAGYTYANTRYRHNLVGSSQGEPLDPALFLLPGSNLSNAPKHVVTTSLAWTPRLGSSGLTGLFYVDGRLTSDYNTGSDLFPEKEQDSYAVVNARLGIRGRNERWSIELWAQNLFNQHYQQVAFNAPLQSSGPNNGTIAQVRQFGAPAAAISDGIFDSYLAEPRTFGVTGRFRF